MIAVARIQVGLLLELAGLDPVHPRPQSDAPMLRSPYRALDRSLGGKGSYFRVPYV